jgi:hypothetical protein
MMHGKSVLSSENGVLMAKRWMPSLLRHLGRIPVDPLNSILRGGALLDMVAEAGEFIGKPPF